MPNRPSDSSWTVLISGVEIVVTAKRVKNLRLVVKPDGQVRASVPRRTTKREAEEFIRNHFDWVVAHRAKMASRAPATARPLSDGDALPLWGDAVVVRLVRGHSGARPSKDLVTIAVPDPADPALVAAAIASLYRREVRAVLPDLVAKWAGELHRMPSSVTIRAMRTRWGSCTPTTGAIRINPDLAARHPRCLSYVVLHEMVHMSEPGHGPGFQALMDAHLPNWRTVRAELNKRPN